jgi:hypothetical protein
MRRTFAERRGAPTAGRRSSVRAELRRGEARQQSPLGGASLGGLRAGNPDFLDDPAAHLQHAAAGRADEDIPVIAPDLEGPAGTEASRHRSHTHPGPGPVERVVRVGGQGEDDLSGDPRTLAG